MILLHKRGIFSFLFVFGLFLGKMVVKKIKGIKIAILNYKETSTIKNLLYLLNKI